MSINKLINFLINQESVSRPSFCSFLITWERYSLFVSFCTQNFRNFSPRNVSQTESHKKYYTTTNDDDDSNDNDDVDDDGCRKLNH